MKLLSKFNSTVRYLAGFGFSAFLIVGFQNCADPGSTGVATDGDIKVLSTGPIVGFKSERTGSGDMSFEIRESGSSYKVDLYRYNSITYSANQKTFTIAKSGGARLEGELDVINLMAGACKFTTTDQASCPGCMTGTWLSQTITLSSKESPVQISGLTSCSEPVDQEKIRTLVIESLGL